MKIKLLLVFMIFSFVLSSCTPVDNTTKTYSYIVTFDSVDGSNVAPIEVTNKSIDNLPIPSKDGFEFIGWYTTMDYTKRVIGLREASEEVSLDVTVYAKWEEIKNDFIITLHYSDGTTSEVEAVLGDTKDVGLPPYIEGYSFLGWYYEPTFETQFVEGTVIHKNIDLYAKVTPVETYLYILFNNLVLDRTIIKYGEIQSLSDAYTLNGFSFEGFYTEPDYINEITEVTGDVSTSVVFAKFNIAEEDVNLATLPYYSYLNENNPIVTITVKDVGIMTLELFPSVAPNTVNNYIKYITDNKYTNSTFHRIIAGFMIQGGITSNTYCPITGDFSMNGFQNNLSHTRGVLSMARTYVNDSATSQFFIVHENSTTLDGSYASFGGLTSGFNVLDYIAWQFTNDDDNPYNSIVIESITIDLRGYTPSTVICAE